MSITKAQAKLLADGFLATLGQQKTTNADMPVIEAMLLKYGAEFQQQAIDNLNRSNSIASGNIENNLVFQVTKFGTTYTLAMGYPDNTPASKYWDFINKGVKGAGGKNAKPKKVSADSPYQYKNAFPNKKMATSILKWYRLGKAKSTFEDQTKKLSKSQRKSKKLKQAVNNADSLKALAYATASAIKRDGLKTTGYFDKAAKKVFGVDFQENINAALGFDVEIKIEQIKNELKDGNNNRK